MVRDTIRYTAEFFGAVWDMHIDVKELPFCVSAVTPGGKADLRGVEAGDEITHVDTTLVEESNASHIRATLSAGGRHSLSFKCERQIMDSLRQDSKVACGMQRRPMEEPRWLSHIRDQIVQRDKRDRCSFSKIFEDYDCILTQTMKLRHNLKEKMERRHSLEVYASALSAKHKARSQV